MVPTPLINGNRYDYSSVDIRIAGKSFRGVKSISYKDSLEPGEVFGTHAQALGVTRGQYKAEGSVEVYKEELDDILTALSALPPGGYLESRFNVEVHYAEAPAAPTVTDKLIGCRVKAVDENHQSGTDPLSVKLDLYVQHVERHGKNPLGSMLR
jgi:hypothetical protein